MAAITADSIDIIPTSVLNINMSNITKLSSTNYLMWNLQVHALLDGYGLAGYLDGSTAAPSPTVTINNITTANPAHTVWKRQDKLIYSGLLGAVSLTIQPILSRSVTAADVWKTLADTYASSSWGHIRQLRLQLKQWTKNTRSIDEYMQGFISKFDQLALLGKPVEHEEQVEFVLDGLPEEFKSVVDQLEGRDRTPTLTEVHEKLLNQEAKLLIAAAATPHAAPTSANTASYQPRFPKQRNNQQISQPWNSSSHQKQFHNKNNNRGTKGYQGKCQICGTFGHSAKWCPQLRDQLSSTPKQQQTHTLSWQPRAHLAATNSSDNAWLMDSGATHHMTSDLHNLSLHNPYHGDDSVLIGDGSGLSITHTGSLSLNSTSQKLKLNDVLCVPHIHKNLISVYKLCNDNKVSVEFFPASFQVKDLRSGVPLLQGNTKGELYEWPVSPTTLTSFFASSTPKPSLIHWHSRLGHPAKSILQTIVSTYSLPHTQSASQSLFCNDCAINKSHKLPFSLHAISSTRPLEYIFTDVWTSPIISIDNYKYYLILIDHFTRYTWLYPLKTKSQVRDTIIPFKALVENRFNAKIGTLYSDNGGEYVALKKLLADAGISHLTSPPHTPEHNGISERKHRHIVETGLSLLTHAAVPKQYWTYAFSTAVYLINRLPTPVLEMESPFSKLFGTSPNYSKLRIFGCLCFPWLRPYTHHKLEQRSTPCIFLGYSLTQSAYLCLQQSSGRIYTSRHVKFDENSFPFQVPTSNPTPSEPPQPTSHLQNPVQIPVTLTRSPLVSLEGVMEASPSDSHRTPPSPPSPSSPSAARTPLSPAPSAATPSSLCFSPVAHDNTINEGNMGQTQEHAQNQAQHQTGPTDTPSAISTGHLPSSGPSNQTHQEVQRDVVSHPSHPTFSNGRNQYRQYKQLRK